jgi:hypothetical protein
MYLNQIGISFVLLALSLTVNAEAVKAESSPNEVAISALLVILTTVYL